MQRGGSGRLVAVCQPLFYLSSVEITFVAGHMAMQNTDNISLLQRGVAMTLSTGQYHRAVSGTFLKRWLGHALFHPLLHPAAWNGDASTFDHENESSTLGMVSGEFQGVGL